MKEIYWQLRIIWLGWNLEYKYHTKSHQSNRFFEKYETSKSYTNRISRLISSLWITDMAISVGFISLSRRQYTLILLSILWLKESSHLNWKRKYLFSNNSSSLSVLFLYCFLFLCFWFFMYDLLKILFNIFVFVWESRSGSAWSVNSFSTWFLFSNSTAFSFNNIKISLFWFLVMLLCLLTFSFTLKKKKK